MAGRPKGDWGVGDALEDFLGAPCKLSGQIGGLFRIMEQAVSIVRTRMEMVTGMKVSMIDVDCEYDQDSRNCGVESAGVELVLE